jgi:hypothetical protein
MRTRITSALSVAVVALVVAAAMIHASPGADATQGQPVYAGLPNTATDDTIINNSLGSCPTGAGTGGVIACGHWGLEGVGGATGVHGQGGNTGVSGSGGAFGLYGVSPQTGVWGESETTGVKGDGDHTGVYGVSHGVGNGVHGEGGTNGVYGYVDSASGSGVRGENDGTGPGVMGSAVSGVGVHALSQEGAALKVSGKPEFSTSGRAIIKGTVDAPKSFVLVTQVDLTEKSLVLVTPQKAVPGAFVIGAVPKAADGEVRIVLNKAVTASYPVAWFVIERT